MNTYIIAKNENVTENVNEFETEYKKEYENKGMLNHIKNKVIVFYNKNKKELWLLFVFIIIFNFMCSSTNIFIKQNGGNPEEALLSAAGKKPGLFSGLKKTNVLQTGLSWMLGFVQSLITFGGLILVLAILPGLPIFIFMLILFFILRARVASLKSI
jgi:hypothetical protein